MIDAPQKADGQWLYLNSHCQSNTPVAHFILITNLVFNRNIPLAQDRSLPASPQQEVETAAVKWLTTVAAGLADDNGTLPVRCRARARARGDAWRIKYYQNFAY